MSAGRFAKGGLVPGPAQKMTVLARRRNGRVEIWEPLVGYWVPVWTAEEIKQFQESIHVKKPDGEEPQ